MWWGQGFSALPSLPSKKKGEILSKQAQNATAELDKEDSSDFVRKSGLHKALFIRKKKQNRNFTNFQVAT